VIVSHENRFIFFKPLKVAGTSIEALLSQLCDDTDLITGSLYEEDKYDGYVSRNNTCDNDLLKFHSHTYPELFYQKTKSQWSDYFKITAVRDPWEVCVSYYWWTVWSRENYDNVILESDSQPEILRKFRRFMLSPVFMDSGAVIPGEWHPTVVDFISIENERFLVDDIDFVIRFENIESDTKTLCKKLNMQYKELPRLKTFTRKLDYHYSKYYDSLTIDAVSEKFDKTISKFNYKFLKK
jgi:hypothetical protein